MQLGSPEKRHDPTQSCGRWQIEASNWAIARTAIWLFTRFNLNFTASHLPHVSLKWLAFVRRCVLRRTTPVSIQSSDFTSIGRIWALSLVCQDWTFALYATLLLRSLCCETDLSVSFMLILPAIMTGVVLVEPATNCNYLHRPRQQCFHYKEKLDKGEAEFTLLDMPKHLIIECWHNTMKE